MNIVEAYIKFNKGLIIVVSGISGCGKTTLARDIERDFNLKLIDQYDYYLEKYDNKKV
jgi:uridine kinase